MKTNSVHSIIVDKQPKYSQFLNAQLFSGYRVRGKDHSKKSQNQLSPSDDQKLSNNLSTSQSYVNAMKALQDKIKSLETENQNLQIQIVLIYCNFIFYDYQLNNNELLLLQKFFLQNEQYNIHLQIVFYQQSKCISSVSSQNSKELIQQKEVKQRQVSTHCKSNENQQIKDFELKLTQMEIEKDQIKEEYEEKIQQLQSNLINIASLSDQKYREQQEYIQQLSDQLELQGESNQNYRNKINTQNQAIQQEKQNNSNLEFILDKEKRDSKFQFEKNERLQDEIGKLKEQLFEISSYMNWYTKEYDEMQIQRLQEESIKLKKQIQDLTSQVEQYKEHNLKLKLDLEYQKQVLEKAELKRVKKLSESNLQIDQLKQQLINLSSNSIIHTQSPRDTQKKSKLSTNIINKTQSLRNYRKYNNDNNNRLFDQTQNSMFNSQQESFKQQTNDLQSSSVFSRLIVKTQEQNFLTQQKSDDRDNIRNLIDERVQTDQLNINKKQKYFQIQQKIHHLNEQLKILNQKYDDIENEISQLIDLKIKQQKRQLLLQIQSFLNFNYLQQIKYKKLINNLMILYLFQNLLSNIESFFFI